MSGGADLELLLSVLQCELVVPVDGDSDVRVFNLDHQPQTLERSLDGHKTCTQYLRGKENERRNCHVESGVIPGGGSSGRGCAKLCDIRRCTLAIEVSVASVDVKNLSRRVTGAF